MYVFLLNYFGDIMTVIMLGFTFCAMTDQTFRRLFFFILCFLFFVVIFLFSSPSSFSSFLLLSGCSSISCSSFPPSFLIHSHSSSLSFFLVRCCSSSPSSSSPSFLPLPSMPVERVEVRFTPSKTHRF